jgi:hypothetical protein
MSKRRPYEDAGEEPNLADVLADPVIHAVMGRDGVTLAELSSVIRDGRRRLAVGTVVMMPPPRCLSSERSLLRSA